jgi:hypothetical protein
MVAKLAIALARTTRAAVGTPQGHLDGRAAPQPVVGWSSPGSVDTGLLGGESRNGRDLLGFCRFLRLELLGREVA